MSTIVIVSGYFNPLHRGHIRMFKAARELGDKLVVIINNDAQQKLKKGKVIMTADERAEVTAAVRYVDEIFHSIDQAPSISETLIAVAKKYPGHKIIFANGGDRSHTGAIPETPVCEQYGIEMIFGVGGNDKPQSSSMINKLNGLE